jgi:hypothetical protein
MTRKGSSLLIAVKDDTATRHKNHPYSVISDGDWYWMSDEPKKAIGQDLQDLQDFRKSVTGEQRAAGAAL